MSQPASHNGAFNGAGPWRPGPATSRHGNAYPGISGLGRAEVEAARALLGAPPVATGAAEAWTEMGWDPVAMRWTDAAALEQAASAQAAMEAADRIAAMADDIESYPATDAVELAALRERELADHESLAEVG